MQNLFKKILEKFYIDGFFAVLKSIVLIPTRLHKHLLRFKLSRVRNLKDRFTMIYDTNYWSSNESVSGEGSELRNTEKLRLKLKSIVSDYNINKIVDAPCGDFNWMSEFLKEQDVDYIGIDIVDQLICQNERTYGSDKINFIVGDITSMNIPQCDLIIIRDCLFHLSFSHIDQVLRNLSKTHYKYLLITSHKNQVDVKNYDIESGDFRCLDLFSPPCNFENCHVIDRVDDLSINSRYKKEMILINKKNVPSRLFDIKSSASI